MSRTIWKLFRRGRDMLTLEQLRINAMYVTILFCLGGCALIPDTSFGEIPLLGGLSFGKKADDKEDRLAKADSSAVCRQEAVQMIPRDQLAPESRAQVDAVLRDITTYRRLPIHTIPCDPEMYYFLANNPDVVVGIWQMLGITELSLDPLGDNKYRLIDTAGTTGTVTYLYKSPRSHLMLCDGVYSGPLFPKPIYGKSLMLLTTDYRQADDGRWYAICRLDTFIKIENGGAELIAKLFQSLVGHVADMNLEQTMLFVAELSLTAEEKSDALRRMIASMDEISDVQQREFDLVTQRTALRARQRMVEASLANSQGIQYDVDRLGMSAASEQAVRQSQQVSQMQNTQSPQMPHSGQPQSASIQQPDQLPSPQLSQSGQAQQPMQANAQQQVTTGSQSPHAIQPSVIRPNPLRTVASATNTEAPSDAREEQLVMPWHAGVAPEGSLVDGYYRELTGRHAAPVVSELLVNAAEIRQAMTDDPAIDLPELMIAPESSAPAPADAGETNLKPLSQTPVVPTSVSVPVLFSPHNQQPVDTTGIMVGSLR